MSLNTLASAVLEWAANHVHVGEAYFDPGRNTLTSVEAPGSVWFGREAEDEIDGKLVPLETCEHYFTVKAAGYSIEYEGPFNEHPEP